MTEQKDRAVTVQQGDALSVTDMQYDFLPGGALGVPGGDEAVAPLNRAIGIFHQRGLPVFFTRDWHPPDHSSFKDQGGPWPPHCVRDTKGAEFFAGLDIPPGSVIISKATKKEVEQYSTFYGQDPEGNSESVLMKKRGVKRVFIGGLATDYCVLNTVKDALKEGYEVCVLTDAIRAVNVNPDDGRKALTEMAEAGARLITTDLLK